MPGKISFRPPPKFRRPRPRSLSRKTSLVKKGSQPQGRFLDGFVNHSPGLRGRKTNQPSVRSLKRVGRDLSLSNKRNQSGLFKKVQTAFRRFSSLWWNLRGPASPFTMMIFMGLFLGWEKVRGSLMEKGTVDLVFYTGEESFTLGGLKPHGKEADISVVHDQVEAQHALLQKELGGGLILMDLGSDGGTWVWENKIWRKLVPLIEEYPLAQGQSFAMGFVGEQKYSKILDPRFAVQLVAHGGPDPFVWNLTTRLVEDHKSILIIRDSMESQSQNSNKISSRGEDGELNSIAQLQEMALQLTTKGHYDLAQEYHRQALRMAMKGVNHPEVYDPKTHLDRLRELGNVRIRYAEFLVHMGDLVEAGYQFNSAGQELHRARLKGEEKFLEYMAMGRAYQIFIHLAREQEIRKNYWKTAFYFEAAGLTVPLTTGLSFLGSDFNPIRQALSCLLEAAVFYRLAEPDQTVFVDRIIDEMKKVPDRGPYGEDEILGIREKIHQLVLALDNPRMTHHLLQRFLKGLFP